MQSGTTGINTTRVYNPIKQAQDHDPHGQFVKRWLPRMRQVPSSWLLEPWRMPEALRLNTNGPIEIIEPLVELSSATRQAKQKLHQLRQQPMVRAGKQEVIGSTSLKGDDGIH
jgi:deoxyribodipyrimidine photo-lyase